MDILSNPTTKTNLAANRVYASPDLASGNATFRQMTGNDLPVITGLSTITPVYNDSLLIGDASPSQNGKASISTVLAIALQGFIFGLIPRWVATNQISVTSGVAHIQNGDLFVGLATASQKTLSSLSANTWYYLYVFESSGVIDWEWSATAPTSPYVGTARSKTSDVTRRYIGAFRTNGSSEIENFWCDGSGGTMDYMWRLDVPSLKRALGGGTATSKTAVSLSSLSATGGSGSTASGVPDSSGLVKAAILRLVNLSTNGAVLYMDNSEMTGTASASTGGVGILQDADIVLPFPINDTREVRYAWNASPTGPGAYLDVIGFKLVR